jgi:hypothetical protein
MQLEKVKMFFFAEGKKASVPLGSRLCLISGILSAALLTPIASLAQINLSPMKIEVKASRNQAQGVINITNTTKETFRARVYAESFTYKRDSGFETVPSHASDLTPYLQFSPRELIVPPGTVRRVRLNARLAPNMPNGEYRTIIFTEPLKENVIKNGGNTTKIITRVGTAFFVRKGDIKPSLLVDTARWNSQTQKMLLLVRNNGKASAFPSVKWTLKQAGKVVKTGEAPAAGIVPESERNLILNTSRNTVAVNPGKYQLSGELMWGEGKNKNKLPFQLDLTVPQVRGR